VPGDPEKSINEVKIMRFKKRSLMPLALLSAAAAVLATVSTFGVTNSRAAGNCSNGYVGLTFDDGPFASTTSLLLSTLQSAGVHATLFNIGEHVAANPSLVAAEQAAGMWIGNHSYTHPHMDTLSESEMESELSRTQSAIVAAGGAAPTLFRPPYGEHDATLDSVAASLGLRVVTWDVDSQDWNGASTSAIISAADQLQNGQIILMHDGYATTRAAIPTIVSDLSSRGLCAGMISSSTGRAVAPGGGSSTPTPSTGTPTPTGSSTPTPTGSSTPTPTATSGSGSCSTAYSLTSSWSGGFVANVDVTAGSAPINGWNVTLTLPSGTSITSLWGGVNTGTSGTVQVANQSYNGALSAGQSTSFGFQGSGSGTGVTASCTAS
jgi:peptidoglycan/xylan/chitin deacetylase (PgdA/CDA1 family)